MRMRGWDIRCVCDARTPAHARRKGELLMSEIDTVLERMEKVIKQWRVGILTAYELANELAVLTTQLHEAIGEEVS